LRDERGAQKGGAAARNAPADLATPQTAGTLPEPVKPAGAAGGANPFSGVTARLAGGGARGSAHEVLRVLRDNLTGRPTLEIAGKRYGNVDEISDGEVRQALLTTVHDLEAFA